MLWSSGKENMLLVTIEGTLEDVWAFYSSFYLGEVIISNKKFFGGFLLFLFFFFFISLFKTCANAAKRERKK